MAHWYPNDWMHTTSSQGNAVVCPPPVPGYARRDARKVGLKALIAAAGGADHPRILLPTLTLITRRPVGRRSADPSVRCGGAAFNDAWLTEFSPKRCREAFRMRVCRSLRSLATFDS